MSQSTAAAGGAREPSALDGGIARAPSRRPRRAGLLLLAGSAVVVVIGVIAMTWGSATIPTGSIVAMVWRRIAGAPSSTTWPAVWETIIFEIRLPRVLLAALAGAALAQAGAVYQGLFRNPLADPYLIGVSAGAGLGATVAIAIGLPLRWGGLGSVSLLAFAGALGATVLVYAISRVGGRSSTVALILAGVAVGSLLSALTTFVLFRASDAFQTIHALNWLMGSFSLASWAKVWVMGPTLVGGGALLWTFAHRLNVLQLDDDQASQLGIPVEATRLALIVIATLVTAVSVSVSGVVGFVGLLVPHAVRLVWGPDHRFLIPMAGLSGAVFVVLADTVARTLLSPTELPVGIVTAFFGAPFFLYLLRRYRPRA